MENARSDLYLLRLPCWRYQGKIIDGLLQVGFGMRDSLATSAMKSVYTVVVILALNGARGEVKLARLMKFPGRA